MCRGLLLARLPRGGYDVARWGIEALTSSLESQRARSPSDGFAAHTLARGDAGAAPGSAPPAHWNLPTPPGRAHPGQPCLSGVTGRGAKTQPCQTLLQASINVILLMSSPDAGVIEHWCQTQPCQTLVTRWRH